MKTTVFIVVVCISAAFAGEKKHEKRGILSGGLGGADLHSHGHYNPGPELGSELLSGEVAGPIHGSFDSGSIVGPGFGNAPLSAGPGVVDEHSPQAGPLLTGGIGSFGGAAIGTSGPSFSGPAGGIIDEHSSQAGPLLTGGLSGPGSLGGTGLGAGTALGAGTILDRRVIGHVHLGQAVQRHVDILERIGIKVAQPYPVQVERKVPVPQPHPVDVPVDRPYPVHVKVPVPYEVIKHVPVPEYVNKPYPVWHKVQVNVPVPVKIIHENKVPVKIFKAVPVPVPHPVIVKKPVPVAIHAHLVPLHADFHGHDPHGNFHDHHHNHLEHHHHH